MEFEKIGKYKILSEIGQGAMGIVYKAHDPILNRYVAIKTISASLGADDDLRKRFHREAQAAARLNHNNIITVYDFGEEHGKIYMAMELLEGTDLKDLMVSGQLPTLNDKLGVMEQILDGLAFAHAKDVVHRDLKPGNIHIQPNGQIKIMDFGLARLGSSEMTQAGVVMGTPNYMSPEQVLGEKVDARSDIFSMGAVFYELLTNHKPFEAESMHGVLFQVVHKEPQPIRQWAPDLPPVLVQIVEKSLIKDKNKRFQHAGEMREAVAVVRQALATGRIHEVTLDMETGRAFFDAEIEGEEGAPSPQRSWPPTPPAKEWVEGTVALDMKEEAPLEEVLETAPSAAPPTLSGKAPTHAPSRARALPRPAPVPTSRAPLYVGGAVVALLALGIGGYFALRPRAPAAVPGTGAPDPGMVALTQALARTQIELAKRDLEGKKYKSAMDAAEQTMNLPGIDSSRKGEAKKVFDDAQAKLTQIENTATEAETAFEAKDTEKASAALQRLLELDPNHPVAGKLEGSLSQFFKTRAEEARKAMAQARTEAERANASSSDDFGRAAGLARDAESALGKGEFAVATRGFLGARDSFDRARRGQETKELADRAAREKQAAEKAAADRKAAADKALADKAAADKAAADKAAMDRLAAEKAAADKAAADKAAQPPLTPPTVLPRPTLGRLAANPTECSSAKGDAGFEGAANPDFVGSLEFEAEPSEVRGGGAYTVKVYMNNTGKKPMKLRDMTVRTSLDGQGATQPVSLKTRDVGLGQKALLWETSGTWGESFRSWVMTATATGDKKDSCTARLVFKKE
jgi:serine/threonine-protein kinase